MRRSVAIVKQPRLRIISILTVSVAIMKLFQYMPVDLELHSNESDDTRIRGINAESIWQDLDSILTGDLQALSSGGFNLVTGF